MKQKHLIKLSIGITATLLAVLVTGISGCDDTPYKVMSVKEGICSFSFEYPETYTLIHLNLENMQAARYSEVGLSASQGNSLSEIYVYIWFAGPGSSSADDIMDAALQNGNTMEDFSLVSRDTVMLGDTVSSQAVFTADSTSDNSNGSELPPRPATFRVSSFIISDVAVEIVMTCDTALTEETADHYQHVLDTFIVVD